MRQIHPTSLHEKFVASGVYIYTHNGEPADFVERWSIHELPDCSQIVRVDRDAMGLTSLIETLCDATRKIERFDIHLLTSADGEFRQARATYIFASHHVQIGRTLHDGTHAQAELPLPPNIIIYPNARIFLGHVLRQISDQGESPVLMPRLVDPNEADVLEGFVESRRVRSADTQTTPLAEAEVFHFLGGSYDEKTTFWVDKNDLLVQYEYKNENDTWLARLINHARRPE